MKKKIFLFIALVLFVFQSKAQWFTTGNNVNAGDWLGEIAGNSQDLKIKTEDAQNIDFYTSTGAGSFSNQRMIIASGGNVGVGLNFTSPSNLLHVHGGTFQVSALVGSSRASRCCVP